LLEGLPESNINISTLLEGHTPSLITQGDVWVGGGAIRDPDTGSVLYKDSPLLAVDEMNVKFDNTDVYSISNIGFVDGRLHIQIKAVLTGVDRNGFYVAVEFVNAEGDIVNNDDVAIQFIADRNYAYGHLREEFPYIVEYRELIYSGITNFEQLDDLSMTLTYMKSPRIIEGQWEFSFMIPDKVTTAFHIDRELQINGENIKINMISLSPLGITIHLLESISNDYTHNDTVRVEYKNGTTFELNHSYIQTYESESSLIFGGQIIEIENVQSILINGERVNISD